MHQDAVEAKLVTILAKSPAEDAHLEPLPAIDIQEVIGLCELLKEHGGRVNFYELVRDSGYLRLMLLAAEGARMLGLVKLRESEVALTPLACAWIECDPRERQRVMRDRIVTVRLIRWLCERLRAGNSELSEEELLSHLSAQLPHDEAHSTFWTLLNWGSYAGIFQYDREHNTVVLRARGF